MVVMRQQLRDAGPGPKRTLRSSSSRDCCSTVRSTALPRRYASVSPEFIVPWYIQSSLSFCFLERVGVGERRCWQGCCAADCSRAEHGCSPPVPASCCAFFCALPATLARCTCARCPRPCAAHPLARAPASAPSAAAQSVASPPAPFARPSTRAQCCGTCAGASSSSCSA